MALSSRKASIRKILTGLTAAALTVTVWQSCTSSTSSDNDAAAIGTQPVAQAVNAGSSLTLSVTATGAAPLAFKWIHTYTWAGDTTTLVDTLTANSASYTVTASPFDAGSYKCIVSNSLGKVISNSVNVTVTAASMPAALMAIGVDIATNTCSQCHQYPPAGYPGAVPPLVHSDYLMADKKRAIRILFLGLGDSGTAAVNPVVVNGVTYNASMPNVGSGMPDSSIAGVLTYMRATFNGATDIVSPAEVKQQRDSLRAHGHSDLPAN